MNLKNAWGGIFMITSGNRRKAFFIPMIVMLLILLIGCGPALPQSNAEPLDEEPLDEVVKDGGNPAGGQTEDPKKDAESNNDATSNNDDGKNNDEANDNDDNGQGIHDDKDRNDDRTGQDDEPPIKDPIIYIGQKIKIPQSAPAVSTSQVIPRGSVKGSTKQIALTFDSGWLSDNTIPLLDLLDCYGIKATFFPRALWVFDSANPGASHPELAREIVTRGHTMGNHSLTHPHLKDLGREGIRHEIRESTRIIEEVTGVRPYLFRPPFGEYNQEILTILGEEGYPYTIMWTVDTHDWAEKINGKAVTVDYIVQRVLANASDNGIVLMHVGGAKTVEALPHIIDGLKDMGYNFTTVDKMLPPLQHADTHTVIKGDTLYALAKKYHTSVEALIELNNL
jgi:peptidoglycan/xylan/chitin deacetylase (PgdA/CDA1 family)